MNETFAGHGSKSLTVEVTPAGIAYLHTTIGGTKHIIALTPSERYALSAALREPGKTAEITTY